MAIPHEPNKHHFVPSSYVAGWAADSGLVVEYSKPYGRIIKAKRVHPNATGFQLGLYRTRNNNFEASHFVPIDQAGSDAIKFLKERSGVVNLPAQFLSGLISFVLSLLSRSPGAIHKEIEALRQQIACRIDPLEAEYDAARPEGASTFREALSSDVPDIVFDVLQVREREKSGLARQSLKKLRFAVLNIPESSPRLLTSDYPTFVERLPTAEALLYLPLSPRQLLVGFRDYSIYLHEIMRARHGLSHRVNRIVCGAAEKFVYSAGDEELAFVQANLGSMPHIRFDAILQP